VSQEQEEQLVLKDQEAPRERREVRVQQVLLGLKDQ